MRSWLLGLLLIGAASTALAAPLKTSSPTPGVAQEEGEPTPVDPTVLKARAEVKTVRDLWDKARLEATVYDKRYRRAYDRWTQAAKADKAAAAVKRDRAMDELKLSFERRRLAWYRWEDARAEAKAVEAAAERKALRSDMERVKTRIRTMEKALGVQMAPSPTLTK
jgi:hypothetical protein